MQLEADSNNKWKWKTKLSLCGGFYSQHIAFYTYIINIYLYIFIKISSFLSYNRAIWQTSGKSTSNHLMILHYKYNFLLHFQHLMDVVVVVLLPFKISFFNFSITSRWVSKKLHRGKSFFVFLKKKKLEILKWKNIFQFNLNLNFARNFFTRIFFNKVR